MLFIPNCNTMVSYDITDITPIIKRLLFNEMCIAEVKVSTIFYYVNKTVIHCELSNTILTLI